MSKSNPTDHTDGELCVMLAKALRDATDLLTQAGVDSPRLDAQILLAHVLGVPPQSLGLRGDDELTRHQHADFAALIDRRRVRQPVSQIVGSRGFWTLVLKVTTDTLDPRPDSECMIETVLKQISDRQAPLSILDFGTGTGCLLLALLSEYPNASGVGVDISEAALAVANTNAEICGMSDRVRWVLSCWGDALGPARYDVIVSNPPYIALAELATLKPEVTQWEPRLALAGGADGLDCYRALMPDVARLLPPNGLTVLEVGKGQAQDVGQLAEERGLTFAGTTLDLSGIERCVILKDSGLAAE